MRTLKKDRRGFTLVELIVVVLVVGILGSVAVIGVSAANGARANACAERISSLLDRTRMEAMSRVSGNARMQICLRDDGYYGIVSVLDGKGSGSEWRVVDEVKLGERGLTLTVYNENNPITEISTTPFEIRFLKGSGAFDFSAGQAFTKIEIVGSNTREIYVYEETGRNTIGK